MQLSSDAGLLVFREFDDQIRWTEQFAAALVDRRVDAEHSLLDMVRMRVYGILADYEDQNDHSTLRKDPVFKLIAGRSPDDPDLASQSTFSRFENSIEVPSLNRLRDVFLDAFIASFDTPPALLTLDIDPFDDPTHGRQQLTFFHLSFLHKFLLGELEAFQAMAKSSIRRRPVQIVCGPGGGSVARLL